MWNPSDARPRLPPRSGLLQTSTLKGRVAILDEDLDIPPEGGPERHTPSGNPVSPTGDTHVKE